MHLRPTIVVPNSKHVAKKNIGYGLGTNKDGLALLERGVLLFIVPLAPETKVLTGPLFDMQIRSIPSTSHPI